MRLWVQFEVTKIRVLTRSEGPVWVRHLPFEIPARIGSIGWKAVLRLNPSRWRGCVDFGPSPDQDRTARLDQNGHLEDHRIRLSSRIVAASAVRRQLHMLACNVGIPQISPERGDLRLT